MFNFKTGRERKLKKKLKAYQELELLRAENQKLKADMQNKKYEIKPSASAAPQQPFAPSIRMQSVNARNNSVLKEMINMGYNLKKQ